MTTLNLKLEIKSWDEHPYRELPEGQKLAQASTTLAGSEVDLTGTMTTLLHYLADGTSTYVGVLSLEGRLGERAGSFVLHGSGTYDGSQARVSFTVVAGSGTGELAGITGNAVSVSTHADYPFMPLTLDYELR
jgi:hypothetical protein